MQIKHIQEKPTDAEKTFLEFRNFLQCLHTNRDSPVYAWIDDITIAYRRYHQKMPVITGDICKKYMYHQTNLAMTQGFLSEVSLYKDRNDVSIMSVRGILTKG